MTGAPYSPEFLAYRAAREALRARLDAASKAWNAIPGTGTGPLGLTPDTVKSSPEWRAAAAAYQGAHKALRELNGRNAKRFKREIAREARESREARLAPTA